MKQLLFFCLATFSLYAKEPILIGIAGGTASGKTTLAAKIQAVFPANSVLLSQDGYNRDRSYLPLAERKKLNFDHPETVDFALLEQHLRALKAGRAIERPIYDFITSTRSQETIHIEPEEVIIVEGILLFDNEAVRDLFDYKIFIEADDDVRLMRRMKRDMAERNLTFEEVERQYFSTVKPMHEAFVLPSKKYADIIVPGEKNSALPLNFIVSTLEKELALAHSPGYPFSS